MPEEKYWIQSMEPQETAAVPEVETKLKDFLDQQDGQLQDMQLDLVQLREALDDELHRRQSQTKEPPRDKQGPCRETFHSILKRRIEIIRSYIAGLEQILKVAPRDGPGENTLYEILTGTVKEGSSVQSASEIIQTRLWLAKERIAGYEHLLLVIPPDSDAGYVLWKQIQCHADFRWEQY